MRKSRAVFGIYQSRRQVERATEVLKSNGFDSSDISVLLPTEDGSREFAHVKSSKAPEGASAGAGTGALVGGGLGWLVGIGALAIPGFGPFIAAGPILAAFAGAGIGGALGGISGAIVGFGVPEYEAKRYETFVLEGGILLSVHIEDSDWIPKAKRLLEITGAKDVAATNEVMGEKRTFHYPHENVRHEAAAHELF